MRVIRLFIAALLTVSLAILPVSAAVARAYAANADMTMSPADDSGGEDCRCCAADGKCPASICAFQCFNLPALLAESLPVMPTFAASFADTNPAPMSPSSRPPDPPPPRF